jgi:hypothetical protein
MEGFAMSPVRKLSMQDWFYVVVIAVTVAGIVAAMTVAI